MSREDPQLKLRLPVELRDEIRMSAARSGRSVNAEIVARLKLTAQPCLSERVDRLEKWVRAIAEGNQP